MTPAERSWLSAGHDPHGADGDAPRRRRRGVRSRRSSRPPGHRDRGASGDLRDGRRLHRRREAELHCGLLLIRRWTDPRLAFAAPAGSEAVRVLPLAEVWHPELVILNQRELRPTLPEQVQISPDGTVLQRQRYQGALASPLDLRSVPVRPATALDPHRGAAGRRSGRLPTGPATNRADAAVLDRGVDGGARADGRATSFEPIKGEIRLPRATLPLTAGATSVTTSGSCSSPWG